MTPQERRAALTAALHATLREGTPTEVQTLVSAALAEAFEMADYVARLWRTLDSIDATLKSVAADLDKVTNRLAQAGNAPLGTY